MSAKKKTTSKWNTDSFEPVCQVWFVTFKCLGDSKPQRDVQQHKLLEVTWISTNRDKPINEASKQTLANNLFKMLVRQTTPYFFCQSGVVWYNGKNTPNWQKKYGVVCLTIMLKP